MSLDVTTVLLTRRVCMTKSTQQLLSDVDFDVVVGPESRGFIFGVPIA